MRLDNISDAFADLVGRAETVITHEIERAKKAVAALNAERTAAQKELAELKDQHAAAKKQLGDVLANLERGQSLARLNFDIAEAKKTLAGLTSETEEASAELATLRTQCKAAESQLNAANDGMQHIRQERIEAEAYMANFRKLVKSFERAA
jgi:chromosome segregation ATPase